MKRLIFLFLAVFALACTKDVKPKETVETLTAVLINDGTVPIKTVVDTIWTIDLNNKEVGIPADSLLYSVANYRSRYGTYTTQFRAWSKELGIDTTGTALYSYIPPIEEEDTDKCVSYFCLDLCVYGEEHNRRGCHCNEDQYSDDGDGQGFCLTAFWK